MALLRVYPITVTLINNLLHYCTHPYTNLMSFDLDWIDHDRDRVVAITNQMLLFRLPWGFERVIVWQHHS